MWTESSTIIQIIFPWLYLVSKFPIDRHFDHHWEKLFAFELISICIKLAGVFIAYYLYNDFIVTTIVYAVIGGLQSATLLLFISRLVRAFDKNQLHYKEAK